MLIGIDVGGTYTDGVLFSEGSVVHSVKHPTDEKRFERDAPFRARRAARPQGKRKRFKGSS